MRVQVPHGRATVSGDERQQDKPVAIERPGRRWQVGWFASQETDVYTLH
jgi:hypothetical protein